MQAEIEFLNEDLLIDNFRSKWLKFRIIERKPKTVGIVIMSKDSGIPIGRIEWYKSFRKYSFFPEADTVFETVCLGDIVKVIDELEKIRKRKANGKN